MIRRRTLSPVEIMDAVLARIEALNPRLNAYLTVDTERAREQAKAAEAAVMRSETLKPLHGLPSHQRSRTQCWSALYLWLQILRAQHCRFRRHGHCARQSCVWALYLAKPTRLTTGTRICAMNLIGPPCRNPWQLERTSGLRAVVPRPLRRQGLIPRRMAQTEPGRFASPRRSRGLLGLKPSFGRVPNWPNADIWAARSHNGPITRTLRRGRCPVAWGTAGPDPRDPTSIDSPPEDYPAAVAHPLEALRACVAWSMDFGCAPVDPEVRRLIMAAAV